MALPPVNPALIDEALAQFDQEERASPKWQGWEERDNYKYAIVKNGRLYPPKEIIALATGVSNTEFSGGAEANRYLRKHGFQIEALRLPTESEVQTALHDLLVTRAPSPVESSEAYRILADQFALSERLRSKTMENSDENHWQNRVRFARRKLVDAGIVDRSDHDRWQLLLRPRPKVWIEKSLVKGRPDRASGEHALGRALWSPLRAQNGADIYRNMRLVQTNDIVLHLTDNAAFTGTSTADGFARSDFIGIDGTSWAGLPCYRIPLRDFKPLSPPLTREQLFTEQDSRQRLINIRQAHSNLFYDPNLDLHQGGYLTESPDELVSLLDDLYQSKTGRHLFGPPGIPNEPLTTSTAARLPAYLVEDFSAESAIPQEAIELWLARLKRKQHLIFQGPPGTGKTYIADRLARVLASNTYGVIDTVQFHPSYGYEDFMQGIRPVVHDGQMTFERLPGAFLQFCKKAREVQDGSPCVLIIDEINRANLSRVFGELMYLLEYRDKKISLAGEANLFAIPPNVYVIGTMNTADRSIALVDHALRRRFSFIHLAPDYDVLRSHLEKNGLAADDLLKVLRAVNAAIDDRNYEIGISFFLKDGAALRSTLKDVWEGEIEPYLEEYFYDQPGKLDPLRWKSLSTGTLASWNT
jgi:5-methylcytosine-specific restriction protein B